MRRDFTATRCECAWTCLNERDEVREELGVRIYVPPSRSSSLISVRQRALLLNVSLFLTKTDRIEEEIIPIKKVVTSKDMN